MSENLAFEFLKPYLADDWRKSQKVMAPAFKLWLYGIPIVLSLAYFASLPYAGPNTTLNFVFATALFISFIAILVGRCFVNSYHVELSQTRFTFYEGGGEERVIPVENLLAAKRIGISRFEVLDRHDDPFKLNMRVLWFTPKGPFQVLREVLHEAANQHPESIPQKWKPRVKIPISPLQNTTYYQTIPVSMILIRVGEFLIALSLALNYLLYQYFRDELTFTGIFVACWLLSYYLPVFTMLRRYRYSSPISICFSGDKVLIESGEDSFEMMAGFLYRIDSPTPHSRIFSKHPIPFQIGWQIAVPDSKKTIHIDPRFLTEVTRSRALNVQGCFNA